MHVGGNAVEIKLEADSNDMTECPHDDKPSAGMFDLFYRMMLCVVQTMLLQDVCVSVRPSATCHYSVKLFHHRVVGPYRTSNSIPNGMAIFQRGSPNWGFECRGV